MKLKTFMERHGVTYAVLAQGCRVRSLGNLAEVANERPGATVSGKLALAIEDFTKQVAAEAGADEFVTIDELPLHPSVRALLERARACDNAEDAA